MKKKMDSVEPVCDRVLKISFDTEVLSHIMKREAETRRVDGADECGTVSPTPHMEYG